MSGLPDKLDVLIVGAGFSGLYQLHHLRKLGFNVKVVEAGSDIGGTWYWNCYPGARVDSDATMYQLSLDEVWKDWSYSVKYPDWKELRKYFAHIDRKLDLRRDIFFDTRVIAAEFDESIDQWKVKTQKGNVFHARFLSMCTGFASKPYTPNFKGLDNFKGICHHTALWPQEGLDLNNKRIGIIGTGASGVQVVQEASLVAKQLVVFQRTPAIALRMAQGELDEDTIKVMKEKQPSAFRDRRESFAGYNIPFDGRQIWDVTPEEQKRTYDALFAKGGFHPLLGGFRDVYADEAANDILYAIWRDRVRERISDPRLQEKLAPSIKPYPVATKRPPLEQTYYDVFNQSNVSLIDVNENGIVEITPNGIRTADGTEHDFDIIVMATGFDSITGSMTQIDIKGTDGVTIRGKWTSGASTYLGLTTANFPNMFFVYATHGPTALSNGPTALEIQSEWVVRCIQHMKDRNLTRIEPTREAEAGWNKRIADVGNLGLWLKAKSWYTGANIPGKVVEHLNFAGGVVIYDQICRECEEKGYQGFVFGENQSAKAGSSQAREPVVERNRVSLALNNILQTVRDGVAFT